MNTLTHDKILEDLDNKFIEWREDLGVSSEQILATQLANAINEIEFLKKRLSKYEN